MYVVTIARCIRTEYFPLREIGTWEKVRYNGGYVVNGVRFNAIRLWCKLLPVIICHRCEFGVWNRCGEAGDVRDKRTEPASRRRVRLEREHGSL